MTRTFLPPFYTIKLEPPDVVRLVAFSLVALLISSLSERAAAPSRPPTRRVSSFR